MGILILILFWGSIFLLKFISDLCKIDKMMNPIIPMSIEIYRLEISVIWHPLTQHKFNNSILGIVRAKDMRALW
jgi:hypothetical protein